MSQHLLMGITLNNKVTLPRIKTPYIMEFTRINEQKNEKKIGNICSFGKM